MNDELGESIEKSLDAIDFGELDEIAAGLGSNDVGIFQGGSFFDKVGKILSGEFADEFPNAVSGIFSLIGGAISGVLPLVILIVGIGILGGFIHTLRHQNSGDGVRDIVHFVTFAAVVVVVLYAVADCVAMAGKTLSGLKTQMDLIFPILLTLMAAVGGRVSASVYQPLIVILTNGVMQIFTYVIMPIFLIVLVFSVIGNLTRSNRFDKFVGFFTSLYKWILGLVFTLFLGFLSIQSITAGAHDGISIRAAKFTMSSYVPFLGGYLSQGFDLIMASSILIKNAVGVAGLYLMLGLILSPILHIVALSLGLKLAAAITEPLADSRISNFLSSINKAFSMLLAIIIGAAFMYFLTVGLIIITGNVL
jgi:stage III sporulation protein AE